MLTIAQKLQLLKQIKELKEMLQNKAFLLFNTLVYYFQTALIHLPKI
jgi:hypothetical protein